MATKVDSSVASRRLCHRQKATVRQRQQLAGLHEKNNLSVLAIQNQKPEASEL